jgi:predicted DsbA family dithiol-disulfide isomerase
MTQSLFVDVWSDVVCPFCYLGTRQLASALDEFEHRENVVVRHRAFELDPHAPRDSGQTLDERLAEKYAMTIERARSLNEKLESDAAALGMTWSMKVARPTNTFDAHRLIAHASAQDLGDAMSERLFRAYFSEGQLLGDTDTLSALAHDVGVADADQLWRGDDFAAAVRADESHANELGISGVPTMLFDDKFMVVGAQGTEQILDVLTRAWARH